MGAGEQAVVRPQAVWSSYYTPVRLRRSPGVPPPGASAAAGAASASASAAPLPPAPSRACAACVASCRCTSSAVRAFSGSSLSRLFCREPGLVVYLEPLHLIFLLLDCWGGWAHRARAAQASVSMVSENISFLNRHTCFWTCANTCLCCLRKAALAASRSAFFMYLVDTRSASRSW